MPEALQINPPLTTEEIQIDSPLSTEEIIESENEIFDNFEQDERM